MALARALAVEPRVPLLDEPSARSTPALDGRLVRPHDLRLVDRPEDGAEEAMVMRVVHLGFQARAELVRGNGDEVTVLLPSAEADELELRSGEVVWMRGLAGVSG